MTTVKELVIEGLKGNITNMQEGVEEHLYAILGERLEEKREQIARYFAISESDDQMSGDEDYEDDDDSDKDKGKKKKSDSKDENC